MNRFLLLSGLAVLLLAGCFQDRRCPEGQCRPLGPNTFEVQEGFDWSGVCPENDPATDTPFPSGPGDRPATLVITCLPGQP